MSTRTKRSRVENPPPQDKKQRSSSGDPTWVTTQEIEEILDTLTPDKAIKQRGRWIKPKAELALTKKQQKATINIRKNPARKYIRAQRSDSLEHRLWNFLYDGPVETWTDLDTIVRETPVGDLTSKQMMHRLIDEAIRTKMQWDDQDPNPSIISRVQAKPRITTNQITGHYGEAAVFQIMMLYLNGAETCSKFTANEKVAYRITEDQDPIDLSFYKNSCFVHFCVKASQGPKNRAPSSNAFYMTTNKQLDLPMKTIVVRWRLSLVDITNPMGPHVQYRLLVKRNFNL